MLWSGLTWVGFALISYLLGGISTAYLVTRIATGQDIRKLGNRNAGANNVYRAVGARAGITVGIFDIAKGSLAILLTRAVVDSSTAEMMAGIAVVAGHNWPVHLGLRGGKGGATTVGVLLAMVPVVAIPAGLLAVASLFLVKRAVKVQALLFIAIPILAWPVGYPYSVVVYSAALPVMVGLTHYFRERVRPPVSSGEF